MIPIVCIPLPFISTSLWNNDITIYYSLIDAPHCIVFVIILFLSLRKKKKSISFLFFLSITRRKLATVCILKSNVWCRAHTILPQTDNHSDRVNTGQACRSTGLPSFLSSRLRRGIGPPERQHAGRPLTR